MNIEEHGWFVIHSSQFADEPQPQFSSSIGGPPPANPISIIFSLGGIFNEQAPDLCAPSLVGDGRR